MKGLPLSTDIFLQIVEFTDIPTLLKLRLVSKPIRQLIDSYEASLSVTIAKNYAWVALLKYEPPGPHVTTFKQLKLFARHDFVRQLALHSQGRVAGTECPHVYPRALGTELRGRLEHGLAIYKGFVEIKKGALSVVREKIGRSHLPFLSKKTKLANDEPDTRRVRRDEYIKGLSLTEIFDYELLYYFANSLVYPHLLCEECLSQSRATADEYSNTLPKTCLDDAYTIVQNRSEDSCKTSHLALTDGFDSRVLIQCEVSTPRVNVLPLPQDESPRKAPSPKTSPLRSLCSSDEQVIKRIAMLSKDCWCGSLKAVEPRIMASAIRKLRPEEDSWAWQFLGETKRIKWYLPLLSKTNVADHPRGGGAGT